MAIEPIENGEDGLSVRNKINTVISEVEDIVVSSPFASGADLISDTVLNYDNSAAGDILNAGGSLYEVAEPGSIDYQFITAGGLRLYASAPQSEIVVSSTVVFGSGPDARIDDIITQADGAELPVIASVSLSNVTADTRRAQYRLAVDGNRDNNTASVTGIDATKIKRGSNSVDFSAFNCDTGIRIAGNVEVAMMDCHADTCGTGVLLEPDGANTPDELIFRVNAHACDTFFETTGTTKMSGHITFGCEQSDSWGAIIETGWFELSGIIRGCGLVDGGCLKTGAYAVLRGSIHCAGGDNTNCEWAASIEGSELHGLHITASSSFANGVRIIDGAEGSARIVLQTSPFTTGTDFGVQIGVSGGTVVNGFVVLPGSEISGTTAINLDNAVGCDIDCASIVGDVLIGASSRDNTIRVPRRNAEVLATFTNNSSNFNKIIFKGNYTLSEMNAFNAGTAGSGCFKGMEVEQCQDFDGARCYYDGNQWVPSHGVLATGTATIPIGSKNISVAHGLGYDPGNHALQIMFESEAFGLGSVRGNVTSTNVVILGENNVVGTDVDFVWTLRKTD